MAARIPPERATLSTPLASLTGIGPKTAKALKRAGLLTVHDALTRLLPRRFDDRRVPTPIIQLVLGERASVAGVVRRAGVRFGGRRHYEVVIADETGALSCRFFLFQKKSMDARFVVGAPIAVSGVVSRWGASKGMVHPEVEAQDATPSIVPIYDDIEGVKAKMLRGLISTLAEGLVESIVDPMPEPLLERHHLGSLSSALRAAHLPETVDEALWIAAPKSPLRRRLAFDELFYLQLALQRRRRRRASTRGCISKVATSTPVLAGELFPFELTGAQQRAIEEVRRDLARAEPMARLLQGDVGSGKTAVAMIAAVIAAESGHQVAMLAPTEILAEQHERAFRRYLKDRPLRVTLLTGSQPRRLRAEMLASIKSKEVDIVVGTHALFEPDVAFKDLGLVIIDEQQRFGVEQRDALMKKSGKKPADLLVTTATPIPRTLAMAFYGDLAISVLDELPPGRVPVQTVLCGARDRERVDAQITRTLEEGGQIFIVHPLVEASEKSDLSSATEAQATLAKRLAPKRVGLLHGRMTTAEKAEIMAAFLSGALDVLVATTVIEVGVDVPGATLIIVEHAERFGLGQLHQLRGRVGRGETPGTCVFVVDSQDETTHARLSILAETTDGFRIAEHDLATRGAGEFFGTRQHGLPELVVADLVSDVELLARAQEEAAHYAEADVLSAFPELAHTFESRYPEDLGQM